MSGRERAAAAAAALSACCAAPHAACSVVAVRMVIEIDANCDLKEGGIAGPVVKPSACAMSWNVGAPSGGQGH
jgi:hypothetical protein